MRPAQLILPAIVLLLLGVGWFVFTQAGGDAGEEVAVGPAAPAPVEPPPAPGNARTVESDARQDVRVSEQPVRPPTPREEVEVGDLVVRGLVLDADSRPVAGALVLIGPALNPRNAPLDELGPNGFGADEIERTTTDAAGNFSLRLVGRKGYWKFAVRAERYARYDLYELELPLSGTHRIDDVVLTGEVLVSGFVQDLAGRGVVGVEIFSNEYPPHDPLSSVLRIPSPRAVSGPGGAFRVEGLRPGEIVLQFRPSGPEPRAGVESDRAPSGFGSTTTWVGPIAAPGDHLSGVIVTLLPPTRVVGRALRPDGSPAVDLIVYAFGLRESTRKPLAWATTDSEGNFRLTDLPAVERVFLRAQAYDGDWRLRRERWLTGTVSVATDTDDALLLVRAPAAVELRPVDADTGAPLEPASIRASAELGRTTVRFYEERLVAGVDWRVLEDGRIRIDRFPWSGEDCKGRLELVVEGRAPVETEPFRLLDGATADLGDIPITGNAAVAVTITDARTGRAVRGAFAVLEPLDPHGELATVERPWGSSPVGTLVERADADGVARIEAERGGRFRAFAYHPSYAPSAAVEVRVEPTGNDVALALSAGGTLVASVLDERGLGVAEVELLRVLLDPVGRPVEGRSGMEETDESGEARFTGLRGGTHGFRVNAESAREAHLLEQLNPSLASGGFVVGTAVDGEETSVVLSHPGFGSLSVRVVDRGAPVAGAVVRLYEDAEEALDVEFGLGAPSDVALTTDGAGRVAFERLIRGEYLVTVEHPAHAMRQRWPLRVEGRASVELAIDPLVVEGRITTPDGAPLEGVRVRAERPRPDEGVPDWLAADLETAGGRFSRQVLTDVDGSYRLSGVDPSTPLVIVAEGAFLASRRSEPFVMSPGTDRLRVDLELEPAGGIIVQLRSTNGDTTGLQLAAFPLDPPGVRVTSRPADENGVLRLDHLIPGLYRFELASFFARDGLPAPFERQIVARKNLEVELWID